VDNQDGGDAGSDPPMLAHAQTRVQEMQQQYANADRQCAQLRERIRTTTEKETRPQLKEQQKVAKQLKKALRTRERELKQLSQN